MIFPSGDQRGLSAHCLPSVIFVHRPPPDTGATYSVESSAVGESLAAANAIHRPSGETLGCQRSRALSEMSFRPHPPVLGVALAGICHISARFVCGSVCDTKKEWSSGSQSKPPAMLVASQS